MEENKLNNQIRCPICNARLFDISSDTNESESAVVKLGVEIKCQKCRNVVKINSYNLVQTPPQTNAE